MRARDIMSSPVVTVPVTLQVKAAAALLASRGFTALPVVDDDDRLIGIVTEADLVRDRIPRDPRSRVHPGAPTKGLSSRPTVGDVMSTPAVAMGPGTDVAVLASALLEARQRSMPIVDGSQVIGIVTRHDLVRVVGRDDSAIAKDVRHKLEVYGGPARWRVDVHNGVVSIDDKFHDEADRHVATVLAEAVPGVVRADTAGERG